MFKNKQGFSAIAFLIILAVLVIGGYAIWKKQPPTPAPSTPSVDTTNWKTYRNEEYGFEFKYPNDWVQCVGIYPKNFLCVKDSTPESNVIGPDKLELFLANDFFKGITNINQLKTNLDNNKGEFSLPIVKKQINGVDFVLAGGCDAGCDHHSLVFLRDGSLLEISYTADGEASVTKDKILSTFRFVK